MSKFPVTKAEGIAPSANPGFKAKYNQDWGLQPGEGKQDFPGNKLNNPVSLRKGNEPDNGWQTIASDIFSEGDNFSGAPSDGGEKR